MTPEERNYLSDFYHANHAKLFLHAYAMLKSKTLAEVAVQEAFQVACQKPAELMKSESPIGWMKKAIEFKALHILREQKRTMMVFVPLDELPPGTEPAISDNSDSHLIDCCLNAVSADELSFFLRIARGESTVAEEAKRLNIKLKTCYARFERIRARLQKALEKNL
ncbi:MAG: sigma-70 family RNA polymerase sigma factor [Oscillibacter sp.]|nr:sigma-70 family RNA polymerase sigma factor [Oscillibacter sp.]